MDTAGLEKKLIELGVDVTLPTLIFSECVLAYIEKPFIEGLLDYLVGKFPCLALLDYEMFNPADPFGKMMVYNFRQRGIPLVGIDFFSSLEAIKTQYLSRHMTVEVVPMRQIYYNYLDQTERARIEKLEFLDELEEFWLVQEHYFMSLARKPKPKDAPPVSGFDILESLRLSSSL